MKKTNISAQYIVALILAAVIGFGIMAIKYVSEQIVAVEGQKQQVESLINKHKYSELPRLSDSLLAAGEELDVVKFTSNGAIFNILKTADFLQQRYKGNVVGELGVEQDYINLDMELRYTPSDTEDFYVLMKYLSTKRNPVMAIDHVEFKGSGEDINPDNATPHEVFARFSLKHPIYHGEAESIDEPMYDDQKEFIHDDELLEASNFDELNDNESYNGVDENFDDRVED